MKQTTKTFVIAFLAMIMTFATAAAQKTMTSSTTLWSGEYNVTGNVTIDSEVSLSGDATVNLAEGATLTVNGMIKGFDKKGNHYALTINGSGTMNVTGSENGTGILRIFSSLTINGGMVNITNNGDINSWPIYMGGVNIPIVLNGGTLHTTVIPQTSVHFDYSKITLAGGTLQTEGGKDLGANQVIIADGYVYEDKTTEKCYAGTLTFDEAKEILDHVFAHNPDAYTVETSGLDVLTMTADCRAAKVGHTVNVTAEATVAGYLIGASYNDGTEHELKLKNGQYSFTMPAANVTISATKTAAFAEGDGSTNNPFLIENAADWEDLRSLIGSDVTYDINKDKCFKLSADISITSRINILENYPFMGTFDGSGHTLTVEYEGNKCCAPFRYSSGATIKNLHVAGIINADKQYSAGIVGQVMKNSTVTIANCRSSVTINSSVSGSSYHGGLVGEVATGATVNINDCVFDGKILTAGSTASTGCGGFVGHCYNSGTANLTNCLYAPAALDGGEKMARSSSKTFVNNGSGSLNLSNCYYTQVLGTAQGTQGILLYDGGVPATANEGVISRSTGNKFAVSLQDRKLYKDGDWNTLVLPFDLTIKGSVLDDDGVKAMVLDGDKSQLDGTTLTLNFVDAPATIPAGTPFIIKWKEGTDLTSPVFSCVSISNANNDVNFTGGAFKGTYARKEWNEETPSILFLGEKNQLNWPLKGAHLNAFRAFFELTDPNAKAREFVMNFEEESSETTNISSAEIAERAEILADAWYTIDGVKLNSQPTAKGIYIKRGKKVVIK